MSLSVNPTISRLVWTVIGAGAVACGLPAGTPEIDWMVIQDSTQRVAVVTGFAGPEAVRYDPEADVYFVSNFNGNGGDRDGNGFISRVSPDGVVIDREFATGTDPYPLHGPRGMFVQGDTLWAADVDGVHGFDRRSGVQVVFVDFSSFNPGFLNDVAVGPMGAVYVTDTGRSRIYRMLEGEVTIAAEDSTLGQPNGITWFGEIGQFLLAPWGGRQTLRAWQPTTGQITDIATSPGGFFDGIELLAGEIVVASQADSSIHVFANGSTRPIVRTTGRPADIGVDPRRLRIAVPYVSLNRVDIWELPVR